MRFAYGVVPLLRLCLCPVTRRVLSYNGVRCIDMRKVMAGKKQAQYSPAFEAQKVKRSDDTTEKMSDKTIQVRLPESADAYVRAKSPNRSAWLRRVIMDAIASEKNDVKFEAEFQAWRKS
jgi:hypothetical protein